MNTPRTTHPPRYAKERYAKLRPVNPPARRRNYRTLENKIMCNRPKAVKDIFQQRPCRYRDLGAYIEYLADAQVCDADKVTMGRLVQAFDRMRVKGKYFNTWLKSVYKETIREDNVGARFEMQSFDYIFEGAAEFIADFELQPVLPYRGHFKTPDGMFFLKSGLIVAVEMKTNFKDVRHGRRRTEATLSAAERHSDVLVILCDSVPHPSPVGDAPFLVRNRYICMTPADFVEHLKSENPFGHTNPT